MAWLREHHADDCEWNEWTCKLAAEHGQLAALQWLRAPERAGGPCPIRVLSDAKLVDP